VARKIGLNSWLSGPGGTGHTRLPLSQTDGSARDRIVAISMRDSPYPPCDPGPCTAPTPFPATVLFAGAAPLEVVGVDQVNVLIPQAAVTGGAVTLTLNVGNGAVSANVYLSSFRPNSSAWWVRLHEKGGKRHEVPAHHHAQEYVHAYLDAAGIRDEKKSPLFWSVDKQKRITRNPLTRTNVLRMVKRCALDAGLPSSTTCHTFRATGITGYLSNGAPSKKCGGDCGA